MNRVSSQPSGNLVIFGGWFFGRVVAETAELLGWTVVGFVDPDPPAWITALTHVPDNASAIVAIGNNPQRALVHSKVLQCGRSLVSIVHPTACVSRSATLDAGCYLAEFATIRSNSSVGAGTILNSGSVVSHDCQLAALLPSVRTPQRQVTFRLVQGRCLAWAHVSGLTQRSDLIAKWARAEPS